MKNTRPGVLLVLIVFNTTNFDIKKPRQVFIRSEILSLR